MCMTSPLLGQGFVSWFAMTHRLAKPCVFCVFNIARWNTRLIGFPSFSPHSLKEFCTPISMHTAARLPWHVFSVPPLQPHSFGPTGCLLSVLLNGSTPKSLRLNNVGLGLSEQIYGWPAVQVWSNTFFKKKGRTCVPNGFIRILGEMLCKNSNYILSSIWCFLSHR